jgi:hypothetical protein
MCHWSEYEAPEITRWFYVQCRECEKFDDVEVTANVWRDGSIYGDWWCRRCDTTQWCEDFANVADFEEVN